MMPQRPGQMRIKKDDTKELCRLRAKRGACQFSATVTRPFFGDMTSHILIEKHSSKATDWKRRVMGQPRDIAHRAGKTLCHQERVVVFSLAPGLHEESKT